MENQGVRAKYQAFVNDYGSGVDRSVLCGRYNIPPERFDSFLAFLKSKGFILVRPTDATFAMTHEIDFTIYGDDLQFVEVELDPGETAMAEAGAMLFMTPWIEMETIFGDGSPRSTGVMERIFGAGKRVLTGESLFMTAFTNSGNRTERVAFSAPYPGKIVPLHLGELGGELICQKDSFLCAAKGVDIGISFQKRLGVGLFGGEGFILQRLQGSGWVFVHAGGTLVQKELAAGERIRLDTGCLVAFQPGMDYDIEFVGGLKSAFFGGEGLFLATVSGPGKVWLQSLPLSRMADRIVAASRRTSAALKGGRREEGSLLGTLGGTLGDLVSTD